MEIEAIKHFKGKKVKLTRNDGFKLYGTILEVYNRTILFWTNQAESLIPVDEIHTVIDGDLY